MSYRTLHTKNKANHQIRKQVSNNMMSRNRSFTRNRNAAKPNGRKSIVRSLSCKIKRSIGRDEGSMGKKENIFGSGMVSTTFVLSKIHDVQNDPNITRLELEDLIERDQPDLYTLIVYLRNFGDREWEAIEFVDTIQPERFAWWQRRRIEVIQNFENIRAGSANVVKFRLCLAIDVGTPAKSLIELLDKIRRDDTVCSLEFSGQLFSSAKENIAEDMAALVTEEDGKDKVVKASFVISLVYDHSQLPSPDAVKVSKEISSCIKELQKTLTADEAPQCRKKPTQIKSPDYRWDLNQPKTGNNTFRSKSTTLPRIPPNLFHENEDGSTGSSHGHSNKNHKNRKPVRRSKSHTDIAQQIPPLHIHNQKLLAKKLTEVMKNLDDDQEYGAALTLSEFVTSMQEIPVSPAPTAA